MVVPPASTTLANRVARRSRSDRRIAVSSTSWTGRASEPRREGRNHGGGEAVVRLRPLLRDRAHSQSVTSRPATSLRTME